MGWKSGRDLPFLFFVCKVWGGFFIPLVCFCLQTLVMWLYTAGESPRAAAAVRLLVLGLGGGGVAA